MRHARGGSPDPSTALITKGEKRSYRERLCALGMTASVTYVR